MTPEAQRIAIGAACGLDTKRCPIHHSHTCCGRFIPNYTGDLNAMNEAEKAVLLGNVGWVHYSHVLLDDDIHTSAARRAEAFLRTLGLWKETHPIA